MMRVAIPISFEVESLEDADESGELTQKIAESAADLAAFNYLSFVKVSGFTTDSDAVEVHVDGFGKCKVCLAELEEDLTKMTKTVE